MTSAALRDHNTGDNAAKDSAGGMANENQQRKARTTRGDKFRDSDDEAPPANTEPKLVKKTKKKKGASAVARATEANRPLLQASVENWDETQGSVEDPAAPARRPPMLASRTATTTGRRPQQEQEWSQASQQREQQFPTWQQENPERPQQRQHQRPARPQHQVPQPRPPEQPWQPLREVQQQLEALQVDDVERSVGAWRGEDPPNRVIREDVMDRVHDRLDKQAWGNKPSAGPSFGAGASSTQAAGGGAAGFAYGPSFGQNLQLDSYIDNFINQSNGGLPQRTNPTYQNPPRNQNVADGRGLLGARAAHHAAPRNAPLQT
ncbi:hypothetical protein AAVH_35460, partial [Aphelenchoides avenae]